MSRQYIPIWQAIKAANQTKLQLHEKVDITAVKRAIKRLKYEDDNFRQQCLANYGHALELAFNVERIDNSEYIVLNVYFTDKQDKLNNI